MVASSVRVSLRSHECSRSWLGDVTGLAWKNVLIGSDSFGLPGRAGRFGGISDAIALRRSAPTRWPSPAGVVEVRPEQ